MFHEWQGPLRPGEKPNIEPAENPTRNGLEDIEITKNKIEAADAVDLSNLKIGFWNEQKITEHYKNKLEEIGNINKWLEKNKLDIERNKDAITLAVEQGLIKDNSMKSVHEFGIKKLKFEQKKAIEIKNILETKSPEILKEVSNRLGKFLPGWKFEWAKIEFVINESSDYCISEFNFITVDLGRLTHKDNFIEDATAGLVHEISHIWINEIERKWDSDSLHAMKNQVKFGVMAEGLAVLFSKQDIIKMQIEKGRDYEKYSQESFSMLKQLLKSEDLDEMDKIREKGFKNAGYFYVTGYEMAKKILDEIGLEKFRQLLFKFRKNPDVFFEEYEKCNK